MDLNQLWQQYLGGLAKTATGQGGGFDVFSAELGKVLAQDYLAETSAPDILGTLDAADQADSDRIDSDAPDPAADDEQDA